MTSGTIFLTLPPRRWAPTNLPRFIVLAAQGALPSVAADILVFAAASLRNALHDAIASHRQQGGDSIAVSHAAS